MNIIAGCLPVGPSVRWAHPITHANVIIKHGNLRSCDVKVLSGLEVMMSMTKVSRWRVRGRPRLGWMNFVNVLLAADG